MKTSTLDPHSMKQQSSPKNPPTDAAARIYVRRCSVEEAGVLFLTAHCSTLKELEQNIKEAKRELDEMAREARKMFTAVIKERAELSRVGHR